MDTDRTPSHAARRVALATVFGLSLFVGGTMWYGAMAAPRVAPLDPTAVHGRSETPDRVESYADIVKAVAPAVVTIRVEGEARAAPVPEGDEFFRRFFGDPFDDGRFGPPTLRQRGLGSGVLVAPDGYVLTNQHVVDNADDIRVDLADGRTLAARIVGSDLPSDLALLRIDATNLPTLPLGDSDAVQVGDVVLAIGNPLGVGQTVTMGIVSAKGRSTGVGDGSYEDFLQTDAPINEGNSGGALVNTRAELIGINSQILSTSGGNIGIGFAIPANMAGRVMRELRDEGRVRRGQLGVSVQAVTADLAASLALPEAGGVIVSSVAPDSPAERAGLKRGDVITALNGQPVRDANNLRNRVADAGPGSRTTLVIVRDAREHHVTAVLDEAVSDLGNRGAMANRSDDPAFGVAVARVTPELASRMGLPPTVRGLLAEEVDPDGRAADAGIEPGDIIEEVNGRPVESPADLRAALHNTSGRPILVLVNRDGKDLFLTVRTS